MQQKVSEVKTPDIFSFNSFIKWWWVFFLWKLGCVDFFGIWNIYHMRTFFLWKVYDMQTEMVTVFGADNSRSQWPVLLWNVKGGYLAGWTVDAGGIVPWYKIISFLLETVPKFFMATWDLVHMRARTCIRTLLCIVLNCAKDESKLKHGAHF